MKYTILATTLSLAFGIGTALADETQPTTEQADPYAHEKTDQAAAEKAKNIQSVDLLFETSSAQLTATARDQLENLARWAKCNENGAVILEGHADRRGTQDYNLMLSAQRAAVVRGKLIDMGVPSERIVVTVFGKNGPQRPTLAENRRVTVRATSSPIEAKALEPETTTARR